MKDRRGKWCTIPRPNSSPGADFYCRDQAQGAQSPKVDASLAAQLRWQVLFVRQLSRSWRQTMRHLASEMNILHHHQRAASIHHAEAAAYDAHLATSHERDALQRQVHRLECKLDEMENNQLYASRSECERLQQQVHKLECKLDEMEHNQLYSYRSQCESLQQQESPGEASPAGAQVAAAVVHEPMPKWAPMRDRKKKRNRGRRRDGEALEKTAFESSIERALQESFRKHFGKK